MGQRGSQLLCGCGGGNTKRKRRRNLNKGDIYQPSDGIDDDKEIEVEVKELLDHEEEAIEIHATFSDDSHTVSRKLLEKTLKSVGLIMGYLASGTGFRVGKKYVMTSLHLVKEICSFGGIFKETNLESPDVYICFNYKGEYKTDCLIFHFVGQIQYANEDLDVAILELKESDQKAIPPKIPCSLDFRYTTDEVFHVIGQSYSKPHQITDLNVHILKKDFDIIKKAQTWSMDNFNENIYTGLEDSNFELCFCPYRLGMDGSPGIIPIMKNSRLTTEENQRAIDIITARSESSQNIHEIHCIDESFNVSESSSMLPSTSAEIYAGLNIETDIDDEITQVKRVAQTEFNSTLLSVSENSVHSTSGSISSDSVVDIIERRNSQKVTESNYSLDDFSLSSNERKKEDLYKLENDEDKQHSVIDSIGPPSLKQIEVQGKHLTSDIVQSSQNISLESDESFKDDLFEHFPIKVENFVPEIAEDGSLLLESKGVFAQESDTGTKQEIGVEMSSRMACTNTHIEDQQKGGLSRMDEDAEMAALSFKENSNKNQLLIAESRSTDTEGSSYRTIHSTDQSLVKFDTEKSEGAAWKDNKINTIKQNSDSNFLKEKCPKIDVSKKEERIDSITVEMCSGNYQNIPGEIIYEPAAVFMLHRGYPSFYYKGGKSAEMEALVTEDKLVNAGVTMVSLYNHMKQYNIYRELCADIFVSRAGASLVEKEKRRRVIYE